MSAQPLASAGQYWLAPHVHCCRTARHIVVLDLRRDLYLGLDDTDSQLISAHIAGWEQLSTPRSTREGNPEQTCSPLLAEMVEAGMLTSDPNIGKSAALCRPTIRTEKSLASFYPESAPKISPLDVARFFSATATAHALLRWRSLFKVTARIARRRQTAPTRRSAEDVEPRMKHYIDLYDYMRPLLLRSYDDCLFDALALSELLASLDIFPQWVFGVSTEPFAAHCWLQEGDVVLNDSAENVCRYTPIMVV